MGGEIVSDIWYVADSALMADRLANRQRLVTIIHETYSEYGLAIIINKTKLMVTSRAENKNSRHLLRSEEIEDSYTPSNI